MCEARVKFFQKLLVAPATASFFLAPTLNGFAQESFDPIKDKQLIAQTPQEEEEGSNTLKISVTGTRTPRELKDVPASVNVINTEDIDNRGISDLRDLFKYDAGVSILSGSSAYTSTYGQNSVNIRGMDNNRVLIQRDDINLPARYTFSYDLGRGDYVDLKTLKTVEIFKGPASSLYGSDALGGLVSYRSLYPEDLLKDNEDLAIELPFSYDGSSNETAGTTRIALRNDESGVEAVIVATKSYGEEDNVNADKKYIDDSSIDKENIYTNIVKNIDDFTRINLIYENVSTERETIAATDSLSSSYSSVEEDVETKRWMGQIGYEYENPDSERFYNYAKLNIYKQNAKWKDGSDVEYPASVSRYTGAPTPAKSVVNDYTFEDDSEGINVQLRSSSSNGGWNNDFTYGVDYSTTFNTRPREKTTTQSGVSTIENIKDTADADTTKYGVYLQNAVTFDNNERVELIAGLRYDKYDINAKNDAAYITTHDNIGVINEPVNLDEHSLNPSLSLIYDLSPDLSAYGKYSTAFRAPTYSELNTAHGNRIASGYYFLSNPELQPETSNNYEVGLKGDYSKLNFSLVGFVSKYEDLIDQTMSFDDAGLMVFKYTNAEEAEIYGWELSSEYNFNEREDGFSFLSSLAASYGENTSGDEDVPLGSIEPFKAIIGLKYATKDGKWTSELINTYVGEPRTSDDYADNPAEPYHVVDFINNFNVNDALAFDIGIYNLTDKTYFNYSTVKGRSESDVDVNRYSEPGRNIKAGFTFKF